MLEARAIAALGLGDVLPQAPELPPLAFALSERRIGGEAGLEGCTEGVLQDRIERILRARAGEFTEHEPRRRTRERRTHVRQVPKHQFQGDPRQQLEARHPITAGTSQRTEQGHSGLRVGYGDESRRDRARGREQPQRGGRDHA